MAVQFIELYLGILYSQKLGASGIGLFQIMMSIYGLATALGVGGYSVAVTRLVSKNTELYGGKSAAFSVKKALVCSFFTAMVVALLLNLGAEYIAVNYIKSTKMILPLKILSFTLLPMSASVCFSSYYITMGKIKTIGIITLFSEFINIYLVIRLMKLLSFTFTGKCAAITLSVLISEIFSAILSFIIFSLEKKKEENPIKTKAKSVFEISAPICAGATLKSFLNMLQNMLIPWGFIKYGLSKAESVNNYGIIKGMAIPVVVFPAALMSSFLTLLIPEISKAYETKNEEKISHAIIKASAVTMIFSVALTGIYIFFGEELGIAFYNNYAAGKYIKILAPLTAFMFLDDVVDSALKGMNEQIYSLKVNICEAAVRVVLLYLLLPLTSVTGYVFVIFLGNILNFILSYIRLSKISSIYIDIPNWIIKPILIILICCITVKTAFPMNNINIIALGIRLFSVLSTYIFICIKCRCLKSAK